MSPEIAAKAPGFVDALIAQGPMGLLVLVVLGIAVVIYRDARADRALYDQQMLAALLQRAKDSAETTIVLQRLTRYLDKQGAPP